MATLEELYDRLLDLQERQDNIDKSTPTITPGSGEVDINNAVTEATKAYSAAQNSANNAESAAASAAGYASWAEKCRDNAVYSASVAVDAKDAAVAAQTAAEQASTEAVTKVENAAQKGANNTFTGVNTFNGELVANKAATLSEQTTVDGVPLTDLQGMQAALSSFLTNIGEISLETQLQPMRGCYDKTWNDWTADNPTWAQQDTLIFYAPFATETRADMDSNAHITSSVKRGIWISPMPPDWDNDNGTTGSNANIITNALGTNIYLYCPRSGTILDSLGNCYYVKKQLSSHRTRRHTTNLCRIWGI